MKKQFVMCATFMLAAASAVVSGKSITLEDVVGGTFAAQVVSGLDPIEGTDQYARISDDGKQIVRCSFKTGLQTAVLFDVDHTEGEHIASFDGYVMSADGKRLLIQTETERIYRRSFRATYYIYNVQTRKLERLSEGGKQQVPVFSPNGEQVAFVRNNDVFLVGLAGGKEESQITHDGKMNEIINGVPDWVYEEEFGFNSALVFTGDGTMLCWMKSDESQVKTYSLQLFKGEKPAREDYAVYPGEYAYKYPKAGESNSCVSLWSYDLKKGSVRQLPVTLPPDGYIPRVKPMGENSQLAVCTLNRHQDELSLWKVDAQAATAQLLLTEHAEKYVKEETLDNLLIGKRHILLPSDRDGYTRLYLYDLEGRLLRTVGHGAYDITAVYGLDENSGDVFYQAAALNAHDRQVFVEHRNGKTGRLTRREGWNAAFFSGDYKYFINQWSDYNTPYVFTLCDRHGKELKCLQDNQRLWQIAQEYGFSAKVPFSFRTSEGVELDGWMILPPTLAAQMANRQQEGLAGLESLGGTEKYPVVMYQYSGPGSQQVVNSWQAGSMGQGGAYDFYLAQQGFVVAVVDGRGTGGRGADFEKSTYLHLGQQESKDQVEAAVFLSTLPFVDAGRIGIWGWSYGGFNTLMSMSEGRQVFKAGVAVAPPTNWRYYDTIYTERYMRTPQENPDGYADNPIGRCRQLSGALLLCHGLADDNVHPQNLFEYSEALVQADKDFRELVYTNRNHSIYGGNTRMHLLRQISEFFKKELK